MTQMTYEEFVGSEEFENYVQDIEAWEELPSDLQAQVAGTGANILGIAITDNRDLQEIEDIDTTPSEGVQEQAQMALDWREETGNPNDCGTQTGWERANQLVNGESLSEDTINRMVSFFARHESTQEPDEPKEDCSRMMWAAWGGDEGKEWAESKQEEFENARENAELSDTDFRCGLNLSEVNTDGWEEWEHTLFELHQQAFEADSDTKLANFTERALPDFVRERVEESIMQGAIFSQFDTLVENDVMQLREFMTEELANNDGWTTDSIAGRLMDLESELSRSEAEVIARTETASIVNSAREDGYEEQGLTDGETFYWSGALGDRTTDACRWLIEKTNPNHGGDPVSLEELKDLIAEAPTHDPEMQDDLARPDDFVVHPNERKTWVRAV